MSKNFQFCNNCGRNGHLFHSCKKPISSLGIICFTFHDNKLKFLLICRKDTLGYVDFIRGKYPLYNKDYIQNIIDEMTLYEKKKILTPLMAKAPPQESAVAAAPYVPEVVLEPRRSAPPRPVDPPKPVDFAPYVAELVQAKFSLKMQELEAKVMKQSRENDELLLEVEELKMRINAMTAVLAVKAVKSPSTTSMEDYDDLQTLCDEI